MEIPAILINPHYQDRYFDVVNALNEAGQIYCKNTHLLERLSSQNQIAVAETGFGAGRVLLTLLDYVESAYASGEHTPYWQIDYASVELHPLPVSQLADILKLFESSDSPQLNHWIEEVIALYARFDQTQTSCWQSQSLATSFGELKLSLWFGEALEMLQAFEQLGKPMRDIWFLEGHGPKANPEIWRREVIQRVSQYTLEGGHCASFTVSAELRRELRAAGFQTDRLPGLGGKKQVLLGTKRSSILNQSKPLALLQRSDQWQDIFASIAAKVQADLVNGFGLVAIEHIGSTSLKDVAAEAIVDLLVIVSSSVYLDPCIQRLKACGYQALKLPGFEEVFVFQDPTMTFEHQIFVLSVAHPVLEQQLLFRDYLRLNPTKAQAYSQLKLDCAQRYPQDRRAYRGAKHQWIQRVLAEAGSG